MLFFFSLRQDVYTASRESKSDYNARQQANFAARRYTRAIQISCVINFATAMKRVTRRECVERYYSYVLNEISVSERKVFGPFFSPLDAVKIEIDSFLKS